MNNSHKCKEKKTLNWDVAKKSGDVATISDPGQGRRLTEVTGAAFIHSPRGRQHPSRHYLVLRFRSITQPDKGILSTGWIDTEIDIERPETRRMRGGGPQCCWPPSPSPPHSTSFTSTLSCHSFHSSLYPSLFFSFIFSLCPFSFYLHFHLLLSHRLLP